MISINELSQKWNQISPVRGGFLLVTGEHPLDFHIGYSDVEHKCIIILDTGEEDRIQSSKAIDAKCYEYESGKYALKLTLMVPALDELFVKLCWDLLDSSKNTVNPVESLLTQFMKWQLLLQKLPFGVMQVNKQKGLLAELLFIEKELTKCSYDKVIDSWVGPEGCDQDFVFEDKWVEVKATTLSSDSVEISSLQQLDRTDVGILCVYFIDKTSAKGVGTTSLNIVYDAIINSITDEYYKNRFECKVAKVGFNTAQKSMYDEYHFQVGNRNIYEVNHDFPRLTPESTPVEIIGAKYKISLSSIADFLVEECE